MKNFSKVYRNQSTIIPKCIVKKKNIKNQEFVKWTINKKTNEIILETLFKEEINPNNIDNIIKTDKHVIIYRNIYQKKHLILPVEVEQALKFDLKIHLLKWSIKDDKIKIEKIRKINLQNISGILKQENKQVKK